MKSRYSLPPASRSHDPRPSTNTTSGRLVISISELNGPCGPAMFSAACGMSSSCGCAGRRVLRNTKPPAFPAGAWVFCGCLSSAHPQMPSHRKNAARTAAAGEMREHGAGRCRICARSSMGKSAGRYRRYKIAVPLTWGRASLPSPQLKRTLRERPEKSGAEGATAPETLRQNGPQGDETLESSRAVRQGLTDGVSRARCAAKSLRFRDRGGSSGYRCPRESYLRNRS